MGGRDWNISFRSQKETIDEYVAEKMLYIYLFDRPCSNVEERLSQMVDRL